MFLSLSKMNSYVIHVTERNKKLLNPLPGKFEIGLLDINYRYKNLNKVPVGVLSHSYNTYSNDFGSNDVTIFTGIQDPIEPYFKLDCYDIEPSIITGNTLRNIPIHRSTSSTHYSEFRSINFHELINKNLTNLNFNWPKNIDVINFTLICRYNAS